ncbi:hypothetical protein [Methylobacterium mesophilicum]|uniref:hypothetical protein n=1 Tax=Methylobacterium mesophilicum TaxID=39956 RepID=UPI002F3603B2
MVRRFTVIQGGLSERPELAADPELEVGAEAGGEAGVEAGTWRVDLRRPGAVDASSVAAWRAMLVRNAVTDPLRDPDHLLPLAQHRPAGAPIAVALAWSRDARDGHETLRGVVPLTRTLSSDPLPDYGGVDLTGRTAVDLAGMLQRGETTSREIVLQYMYRIQQLDHAGPGQDDHREHHELRVGRAQGRGDAGIRRP